ncbi:MAG: hypothetical protein GWO41_03785 [candidate division Zixibacteria bacterium]|nr:hypothetical protein [candidate division Zixibacteria bacterium]NIT51878.1 hypothetical protein [candidate division Zixibacteria bacterium]NIW39755.1 hypothetical protein [candidate division Zixibacteria bacterium]NIX54678.1 hypothetical protein [candidate division Zixibacteria bacterium]
MPDDKRIALITSRLKRLGGYILGKRILYGFLLLLSLFLAASFLAALSHALFYLPTWYRTAFVSIVMAAGLGFFLWFIVWPIIRKPSNEELALLVEKRYPDLKNRMIGALQLERKLLNNKENYSPALIEQCIQQAEELSNKIEFKKSYQSSKVSNGFRYLGVTLIFTFAFWFFSPGIFNSSMEVFSNPLKEIPRVLTYDLQVSPQNADVLKFDDLEIDAFIFGSKLPDNARIHWKFAEEWRSDDIERQDVIENIPEIQAGMLVDASDTSLFKYDFKEIRHDFQYYVEAGDRVSDIYNVRVVDKPRINNIKLTYYYPKYTGLAPVVLDENDGTIQALKGTVVKIEGELNKPVVEGKIIYEDDESDELQIEGNRLEKNLKIMGSGSYHLEVTDNIGHSNPDPIEYKIYMTEDSYPSVEVVRPGNNIDLDDYLAFDLAATLSDDYGFSRLVLHYTVHLSPMEASSDSIEFKFDKSKADQLIEFYWDLSNKGLYPGSFVDYYFEVWDNDNISGPKSAVSRTYTARHPTIEEMFVDIEEAREDMIFEMVEAFRQEMELQERAKELREDLQFQDETEWETQKDIEKMHQEQEKVMNSLEKMAEQFDKLNQEAKKNDLLTLEMIQKLNELQKLFDEVATEEMKEAMKKLQEALENMDKNELEQAMKDFEMSTEEMIQNIERSIAQLKRFQIEQKMQAMIAMAEKILENQDAVNEKAEQSEESELPNLKSREDQNESDTKQLKKEASKLREMLEENKLEMEPNAGAFCQSVENTDADTDMNEMSESLQNQQKPQAMQSGQTASAKIEDMLSQMKDAQARFNNQMSAEMAQRMREAIDDLLYLSDEQEALYNEILPLNPRSQMLPEYAQKQQDLKSEAERLRQELQEVAKQSVFIQNALDQFMKGVCNSMGSSISSLTDKNGRAAANYQSDGIYSLNQSAQTLIESLNSQSQCNSSCSNNQSMFQKMNKLSKGQQKVNKQTQSMCNNPGQKPGKPSEDAMRRLAAQQQGLRQGINEMIDEFGDRKDVTGRLDKMAEEMKKVIEALESGDVGSPTLERQKRIHSRMLDFQLSLERRDYSEKRRADTGEDVVRKSPAELELEKRMQESAYRAKLEKFLDEAYPPEYESLIKDYYKALINNNQDK